jgi:hypothetical protein
MTKVVFRYRMRDKQSIMNSLNKRLIGIALIIASFVLGVACAVMVTKPYLQHANKEVFAPQYQEVSTQVDEVTTSVSASTTALSDWLSNVVTTTRDIYKSVGFSIEKPPQVLIDAAAVESNLSVFRYSDVFPDSVIPDIASVRVGGTFTVTAGCLGMSQSNQYTVNKIMVENGHWKIFLTQKPLSDTRSEWIEGDKYVDRQLPLLPPSELILEEGYYSHWAPVNNSSSSVLQETAGVVVPVYVTGDEVFFQYIRLSC